MCQRGWLSGVQLQMLHIFGAFCMYIMFLNLVHKLKCETNFILIYLVP